LASSYVIQNNCVNRKYVVKNKDVALLGSSDSLVF